MGQVVTVTATVYDQNDVQVPNVLVDTRYRGCLWQFHQCVWAGRGYRDQFLCQRPFGDCSGLRNHRHEEHLPVPAAQGRERLASRPFRATRAGRIPAPLPTRQWGISGSLCSQRHSHPCPVHKTVGPGRRTLPGSVRQHLIYGCSLERLVCTLCGGGGAGGDGERSQRHGL